LIHDDLSEAVAITQIDESKRAKIAPPRTPTHQRRVLANVFLAQRAAGMSALKIAEVFNHLD
jgi:hypothetical protein